jgi:endogenous inhibitor of DNA gyrase (YacG/DUF329 family)
MASHEEIRVARCPLCGKAREMRYRPFCSARCANVDLSRWLNGVYAVPAKVEEEEDSFDMDTPEGAGGPRELS